MKRFSGQAHGSWGGWVEPAARSSRRSTIRGMLFARFIGLNLGAVAVGYTLWTQQAPLVLWPLLASNAWLWPFLANLLSRRGREPMRTERWCLVADSAAGGFWIAMMHFNPAPSLLLVLTLSMDKVAFGGFRFLAITASAQALACVAAGVLTGFALAPASSTAQMLACLPHLLVYPLLVANAAHGLLRLVEKQRQRLAAESRRDALTGLYNRSYWEDIAQHEFRRFQRFANFAAIMLVDIDQFKSINDRYGHARGDEAIKAVAAILREEIRATDTAARFGGDEFVVLLADTPQAAAIALAQRIVERVRGLPPPGGEVGLSTSIGVAAVDLGTTDTASWFHRADLALYEAKRGGRDRVSLAPAAAFQPRESVLRAPNAM